MSVSQRTVEELVHARRPHAPNDLACGPFGRSGCPSQRRRRTARNALPWRHSLGVASPDAKRNTGVDVQVHLIDGTFELFRAYYSAPSRLGPGGTEVGATVGLLRSVAALLRAPEVTHVAVAFDHVIESFRNELFAGYKTGAGIEAALLAQFPLAEQAAAAAGLVVWPMLEFEADDALATAAQRFARDERVERVVLCSPDKDLVQCLVDPKVELWDRIRDRRLDAAGAREKFGIEPRSMPDYLALVGDSADGIPGIARWGAKSAAAVLSHYHHIEAIPERAEAWQVSVRGARALAENLAQARDQALLYRTLATLRVDVPLEQRLEELEYRGADVAALGRLAEQLGEGDWMQRLSQPSA